MILGHKKQLKILEKIREKGITSGSFLFTGPEHVGKFTVALDFAKKINKEKKDTCADIIIIQPEIEESRGKLRRMDIKIEKIRELHQQLSLAPEAGKKRIAIIDDADRLNKAAQNGLLKILEEPQKDCLIILVVQNEQKMLPTILSRCRKMFFGTVKDEILEKNIPAGQKNREALLFWSFGRPGLLMTLMERPEELANRENALKELEILIKQSLDERFSWAEKASQDAEKILAKLNLWLAILRNSLFEGKFAIKKSPVEHLKIIAKIEECLILLKETNVNSRLTLENLLINL